MKSSFLLLALLGGTASAALAQTAIPAGTVSLGGNIGYSRNTGNSRYSSGPYSGFNINASPGYFIADNLELGLGVGYTATKYANGPFSDASTTFNVGPYVRYYRMLGEQFALTGTLGASYIHTSTPQYSSVGPPVKARGNGFFVGLIPGITFFPIPKLGISASIGGIRYDRLTTKEGIFNSSSTSSTFGASFGLDQLQFGGTYFFGR